MLHSGTPDASDNVMAPWQGARTATPASAPGGTCAVPEPELSVSLTRMGAQDRQEHENLGSILFFGSEPRFGTLMLSLLLFFLG